MNYIDFIQTGFKKMTKRPTQEEMGKTLGIGKAAINHRLNTRKGDTNKTAKEVFQLLAFALTGIFKLRKMSKVIFIQKKIGEIYLIISFISSSTESAFIPV